MTTHRRQPTGGVGSNQYQTRGTSAAAEREAAGRAGRFHRRDDATPTGSWRERFQGRELRAVERDVELAILDAGGRDRAWSGLRSPWHQGVLRMAVSSDEVGERAAALLGERGYDAVFDGLRLNVSAGPERADPRFERFAAEGFVDAEVALELMRNGVTVDSWTAPAVAGGEPT